MNKEDIINILNKNNIKWSDEGFLDEKPFKGLKIFFTDETERLKLLRINEEDDNCFYSLSVNKEIIIQDYSNTKNLIESFLKVYYNEWLN